MACASPPPRCLSPLRGERERERERERLRERLREVLEEYERLRLELRLSEGGKWVGE